jgi:hypothetical protein
LLNPFYRRVVVGSGADKFIAIAGYLAFLIAFLTVVVTFAATVADHQWGLAAAWAVSLAVPAYFGWYFVNQRVPEPPRPTKIFRPFAELQAETLWPRDEEVHQLIENVVVARRGVTLVVGSSGAGKTILLKHLLPNSDEWPNHLRHVYVASYSPTHIELEEKVRERHPQISTQLFAEGPEVGSPATGQVFAGEDAVVVVLDQFEKFLGNLRLRSASSRRREQEWFTNYVSTNLDSGRIQFVIAVRREWFYDLHWLADFLPSIGDCVNITAPSASPDDRTREKIVDDVAVALALDERDDADDIVEELSRDGRLLPLEVQIVGATLERAQKTPRTIDGAYLRHDLGGVDGAIRAYFNGIIDGAPDPRVALKILCALSVRTRFRGQERLTSIVEALFEDESAVQDSLTYLTGEDGRETDRLVVEVRGAEYELAHDYLADVFHQQSGSGLDPTDRDNILFHIEGLHEARADRSGTTTTQGLVPAAAERGRIAKARGWALIVLAVLVVAMTIRLGYFGLHHWWYPSSRGPGPRPLIGDNFLDTTYFPVYVVHLTWAIYIVMFYNRIFRFLRESPRERWLSRLTVLSVLPAGLVGMFLPSTWMLSIALCGAVIALRILLVSRSRAISPTARARMRNQGKITLGNMSMAALVGGAGALWSFTLVHGSAGTQHWLVATIIFSTVMTVACLMLAPTHVYRAAVAQILGLLSRPPIPVVPRPEP